MDNSVYIAIRTISQRSGVASVPPHLLFYYIRNIAESHQTSHSSPIYKQVPTSRTHFKIKT